MNTNKNTGISTRYTYLITFLLGLAFSITLMQSTWKTAIERKQQDFHFETLSIQQSVTNNVLAGNDVTNNIVAFFSSNGNVSSGQFNAFVTDVLERYEHIEAVNYYELKGNEEEKHFPLVYEYSRDNISIGLKQGEDVYLKPKYKDAIDTSLATASVVPSPPDMENNSDRKYWLFKAVYSPVSTDINKKETASVVTGMVSVLVSPTKLLGVQATKHNLTVTMFSDTSNIYGRQLLYFNDASKDESEHAWKVDSLKEEKLIQLPPYSIKIILEKDLYFTELEHHILFVSLLISVGILMMLYGLVRAKAQQEAELRQRNEVIEKQVEEQTRELAIARDEALEAVRMKSEFLASMSHEIRTPLNAIIGMSDLMSETKLSDEQSRYVSVFKKAGDALLSLVNDILDLSKMEADQLVLEEIPFNALELIEEVSEIYALKASDKNIEIIPRIDAGVNIYRVGDPGRLKQVILNLISNALKFTEEGDILVSLSNSKENDDDRHLLITVLDTGIGIPKSKLEAIFASFTQADTSTTRKYGGTGLGLTISKRLTEMMDGRIWVESEEGKGSCFYVRVALPEQSKSSKIKQDFENETVFITDSRSSICQSLNEQLTFSGAKCFEANSIEKLNELIEEQKMPEAILIDSRLVFINGKITDSFGKNLDLSKVILLVNPKDVASHTRLANESSINRILIKPIKRKELIKAVNKIITKKDDSIVDETELIEEEQVKAKHILLVEDNPDNRMLIKAYLKKTPHTLDEAENGSLAVEMYKEGKYDLVFMDVQMPVMDGHEATRLIRAWEQEQNLGRTVIVSLTAHAIKEEVDKCMAAGCDTHLSKPIKKATLLQTINELG